MQAAALKLPSTEESQQARSALQALEKVRKGRKANRTVEIRPSEGGPDISVVVPREAFDLFLEVLGQMANGSAVTIVPVKAELTTQQAADMLNVSRPHLIELLEAGKIPFRRVGTHRRIRASDLITYQQKDDAERKAVLDQLTEEAQKHGLGY
jgi:excisionase family DNA binding protein